MHQADQGDLLSLFPAGSSLAGDGMLIVGGCRADDLAAAFGTPVLVVAEDALRSRAREYRDELSARWPDSRVVFASKAFPCTAVQRVMVEEGLGLDVAGGGEILTALKAGADPGLIVLHGNAKSDEEIALAVEHGIGLVVVDNADDVDRLEATGRTQDVLVRIIPGVTADTHSHVLTGHDDSKFGLAPSEAARLIQRIERSPRLRMRGLHVHVGSQIRDLGTYERVADWLVELISEHGLGDLPLLDLGGGFGIAHSELEIELPVPDAVEALVLHVAERLIAQGLPLPELLLEPGRSIAGPAGVTLYTVGAIKSTAGGVTYAAVDGGMSDNPRPALYGARYDAIVCDRADDPPSTTYAIAGKHCESGDVLIDAVDLPELRSGDVLATPATGAYAASMASTYNLVPRPAAVMVDGGRARLAQRRETVGGLLAREL